MKLRSTTYAVTAPRGIRGEGPVGTTSAARSGRLRCPPPAAGSRSGWAARSGARWLCRRPLRLCSRRPRRPSATPLGFAPQRPRGLSRGLRRRVRQRRWRRRPLLRRRQECCSAWPPRHCIRPRARPRRLHSSRHQPRHRCRCSLRARARLRRWGCVITSCAACGAAFGALPPSALPPTRKLLAAVYCACALACDGVLLHVRTGHERALNFSLLYTLLPFASFLAAQAVSACTTPSPQPHRQTQPHRRDFARRSRGACDRCCSMRHG